MRCSRMEKKQTLIESTLQWTLFLNFPIFSFLLCSNFLPTIYGLTLGVGIVFIDTDVIDNDVTIQTVVNMTENMYPTSNVNIEINLFNFSNQLDLITSTATVFQNSKIDLIFGYVPYEISRTFGVYSEVYRKPYITANQHPANECGDYSLSVFGTFQQISESLSEFLGFFKWQHVALMSTNEIKWYRMSIAVENNLYKNGFEIGYSKVLDDVTNQQVVLKHVGDISAKEKGNNNFISCRCFFVVNLCLYTFRNDLYVLVYHSVFNVVTHSFDKPL